MNIEKIKHYLISEIKIQTDSIREYNSSILSTASHLERSFERGKPSFNPFGSYQGNTYQVDMAIAKVEMLRTVLEHIEDTI